MRAMAAHPGPVDRLRPSGHAGKKTAPAPLVVGGLHTGAVSFSIPRQIRADHLHHAIIPDHCHLFLEPSTACLLHDPLPVKITFGEMRESGVRWVLVYGCDYKCSHLIEMDRIACGGRTSRTDSLAHDAARGARRCGRTFDRRARVLGEFP